MTTKNKKVSLSELASIRSGLVLSRKRSQEERGEIYALLTLRSVKEDGELDMSAIDRYVSVGVLPNTYQTSVGDVIVRLTWPYSAVLIDEQKAGMLVSSHFVIIRPDRERLNSGYLHWILNRPAMRRRIYENTSANMMNAVRPQFFSKLNITHLPMAKQVKIAALQSLHRREQILLKRLRAERALLAQRLTENIYNATI
ncbi:MAG: restriction endonuclease subunit S [Akkermansiaceae bacterium]|nr:restriction endonuclease subunit S [Akkermansiaceae bacterium]